MQQIEAEAAAKREATGIEPVGREAILRQSSETRPAKSKKSPAPRFHAFTQRVRRELFIPARRAAVVDPMAALRNK